jgi:hypothetical protein
VKNEQHQKAERDGIEQGIDVEQPEIDQVGLHLAGIVQESQVVGDVFACRWAVRQFGSGCHVSV